jgi:hypothetical protein
MSNNKKTYTGEKFPGRPKRNIHSMSILLKSDNLWSSVFKKVNTQKYSSIVQESCNLG